MTSSNTINSNSDSSSNSSSNNSSEMEFLLMEYEHEQHAHQHDHEAANDATAVGTATQPQVDDATAADTAAAIENNHAERHENPRQPSPQACQPARIAASGSAGCILGCIISGPILAAIAAIGMAYASASDDGATGDLARAMGDVALATQAKAVAIDKEYDVTTKAKDAAARSWESAKQLEKDHEICQRSGKAVIDGGKAVVAFSKRHRLLERGTAGCTVCLKSVASALQSSMVEEAGEEASEDEV